MVSNVSLSYSTASEGEDRVMGSIELKSRRNYLFSFSILFLVPLSGLCIDLYTPALPQMAAYFSVSKTQISMTVAVFLVGFGASQLFWGWLSDCLGRVSVIKVGLLIAFLSCVLICLSQNFILLIFARLCEGLGMGAINPICRVVFMDIYKGRKLLKYMQYISTAWAISPVIAPFLGGYLVHFWNWKTCFYFILFYMFLCLILVSSFVDETIKEKKEISISEFRSCLMTMIRSKVYNMSLLLCLLSYSSVLVFLVQGPFLIQRRLGLSAIDFGNIASCVGLAWMLGVIITRFRKVNLYSGSLLKPLRLMLFCSVVSFIASQWCTLLILYMVNIVILTALSSYVCPTLMMVALSQFRQHSGMSSALLGVSFYLLGGVVMVIASYFTVKNNFLVFLPYIMVTVSLLLFYSLYLRYAHQSGSDMIC